VSKIGLKTRAICFGSPAAPIAFMATQALATIIQPPGIPIVALLNPHGRAGLAVLPSAYLSNKAPPTGGIYAA